MPMPVGGRLGRSSRFLVEYDYRDGFDRNGLPIFRSGQIPSYARGGTVNSATGIDRNGRLYTAGPVQPRLHHEYDAASGLWKPRGLLLEGSRKNLVLQASNLSTAPWAGGAAITENYRTYAGRAFSRQVAVGVQSQSITAESTGTHTLSFLVHQTPGVAATLLLGLWNADGTAGIKLCQVDIAADGTCTTGSAGWAIIRLGDGVYRFWATTLLTASTSYRFYSTDNANGADCLLSCLGVELGASPSSIIPTTGVAVVRPADLLLIAFNAPPRAMTVYADFVDLGASLSAGAAIFAIGTPAPSLFLYNTAGVWKVVHREAGDVSSTAAASASFGDSTELRAGLAADGSVLLGQSINGAAEVDAATSAANALGTVWTGNGLRIGALLDGTLAQPVAVRSFRIAADVRTMDYMRAGN